MGRTRDEKLVSACAAACFWIGEVGGVTVDVQDHVAGRVANGRVRVRGSIIEQPQGLVIYFVGDLGLGCCDGAEGDEHGDNDGNRILDEIPNDLLNKADGIWREVWESCRDCYNGNRRAPTQSVTN